jgi:hypothetical protein
MDHMDLNLPASWSRKYGKWGAYLLILLTPGSFVLLPMLALIRLFIQRRQTERRGLCVPHV